VPVWGEDRWRQDCDGSRPQRADRLLIRPASGRQAGTGLFARTDPHQDTRKRSHCINESRAKSTGTTLTTAPDGTPTLTVRLDGRRVGVALLKLADPSVAECWNRDRDARRARGQPALGGRELATRSSHQLASSSCETPCCDTGRASRLLLRPEACRQEAPRRGARQQLIPSKMDQRNELPPLPLNRHGYRARATQNPR